jgi:hypothetical protein
MDSGSSLFGGTGWLFADLLLALALTFLVATTVVTQPPPTHPRPHVSQTPTPTPTPTPKPTGSTEPALDLAYVTVNLTINPGAVSAAAVRQAILANPRLAGRQAGLVILFAGGDSSSPQWEQLDSQVWGILKSMGDATSLFNVAVSRQFWGGGPLTTIELNIYLFKIS